ncbi:calcium-activated chloride channel regulator 1-like [Strongylocentrotus purpuratus]|uniref:Calcium-activated chloride channel N-terminal domain-containing protein n=1 Tax=Strongylocentrotus purpuratus TaxID=7668 RepID=A0A7M7N704_STRPU|nr:calcium-activated chloride channel regulator 1-like [Strongylocentrotus purpuratus]
MSPTENLIILLSVLTIFNSGVVSQDVNQISLEDGEFRNVLVAIDEGVQEDPAIIQKIKDMFVMGSPLLFNATELRAFWKEILILVPRSWTRLSSYGFTQSESYNRANIRIFSGEEATDPVVVNHLHCGMEGHHLEMTSGYLQSTSKCHNMDIVRYWARLRWGLMPEDYIGDDKTAPSYMDSDGACQATRCSLEIEVGLKKHFPSYSLQIVEFCNSNTKDKHRYHNFEAPNLQNIKCAKSAWDVLHDSDDFVDEKNPPMPGSTNTAPAFRILQPPKDRHVVLVLDISGSMNNANRFNKYIQAATIFIMDLVPAGSEILGVDSNGSYIFLLSDGEENRSPYIRDVLQDVNTAGVVIDTVAITQDADQQMEDLANMTGGRSFFCHDLRSSACVTDALLWTIVERPHLNTAQAPIVVKITDVKVPPRPDAIITTVVIGEEEGNDTMMAVTWLDFYDMDVIVEGPHGEFIDELHPSYTIDRATKIITIRIPVASPGNWDITMLHNEVSIETVGVTVTTKPRQTGDEIADVHVFLSTRNVNFKEDPKLGIFALVQRGHNVVKNADVQAVVGNSIGSITSTIQLNDLGTGSDFMKDDGVYSGYFLNFDADGRYSVTVNVLGAAASNISHTDRKRRAITPTPPSVPSSFMRSASGGVFAVNNYIPNAPDVLAPSRIQDLAYSSFSYENATVILTWTAVGDDLDQGTASEYELRYSNDFDVLRVNFTENPLVNDHQIIDGNLSRISPGGQSETLTILLPVLHYDLNYYFSIRALDEAGNAGAISNIVSLPIIEPYFVSTSAPSSTTTVQDFTDGTTVTTSTITEPPSKEPEATKGPDESKDLGLIIGLTVAFILVLLVCALVYAKFFYKKKFTPRYAEGVNHSGESYQSTENPSHANPAYNGS